jgi:DNA invertase Pin-like site-specific DNA recombinase
MATKDGAAKRIKTPEEKIDGLRRQIKSVGIAAEDEDPWMVADLYAMRELIEERTIATVAALRAKGYTWDAIAFNFEITSSTIIKRWGKQVAAINAAKQ